uniref:Uncharacterized protein n=1 Tax=Rhizophora mucronata TaxID=61149 RepID=A0A2P2R2J0_RHIMU
MHLFSLCSQTTFFFEQPKFYSEPNLRMSREQTEAPQN